MNLHILITSQLMHQTFFIIKKTKNNKISKNMVAMDTSKAADTTTLQQNVAR